MGTLAEQRALAAIGAVVVAALTYATLDLFDHWSRFAILGGIVLTAIGAGIAISPGRKVG